MRHVAKVLVERPAMPERVDELTGPSAPEGIVKRFELRRTGIERFPPRFVGVVDGEMQRTVRAAERQGRDHAHLRELVRDGQEAVTEAQFDGQDLAVGQGYAAGLHRTQHRGIPGSSGIRISGHQVAGQRAHITYYTICLYLSSIRRFWYDRQQVPQSSRPAQPARRRRGRRDRRSAADDSPELREAILVATASLLAKQHFADLTIRDILSAAGVSRGTFYFYFDGKHDVLEELVRRSVAHGRDAASPWLANPADKTAAIRAGTTAGAQLWQANAPVLRAIVENWRTDPRLTTLWLEQMQSFTDATIAQISADPQALERLAGVDVAALASALTWLGERLYYLAATDTPPFNDQDTLIGTLVHIWTSTLYGT
jgi:TetR/AcrR family transcriptional regulator, ethionamide resistance regulator